MVQKAVPGSHPAVLYAPLQESGAASDRLYSHTDGGHFLFPPETAVLFSLCRSFGSQSHTPAHVPGLWKLQHRLHDSSLQNVQRLPICFLPGSLSHSQKFPVPGVPPFCRIPREMNLQKKEMSRFPLHPDTAPAPTPPAYYDPGNMESAALLSSAPAENHPNRSTGAVYSQAADNKTASVQAPPGL